MILKEGRSAPTPTISSLILRARNRCWFHHAANGREVAKYSFSFSKEAQVVVQVHPLKDLSHVLKKCDINVDVHEIKPRHIWHDHQIKMGFQKK